MLLSFFNKAGKKVDDLREALSDLHTASRKKLHESHPHIKKILEKHNIDPEKVRQAAPRVLVASALLGAFLAYPHLFGKPYTVEEGKVDTAAHVTVAKKPAAKEPSAKNLNADVEAKGEGGQSGSNSGSSPFVTENNGSIAEEKKPEVSEEKSQGHIYGRSAMAPPKEHGLHDLGLHKGEDNNPDNPEKGEHPEELNLVKNENGGKDK